MLVALNGQVTTILGELAIGMHLSKRFFSTFRIKESVGINIFKICSFPGLVTMATLAQIFPLPLQLEPRAAGGRQAWKWLVMASQGSLTLRSHGKVSQLERIQQEHRKYLTREQLAKIPFIYFSNCYPDTCQYYTPPRKVGQETPLQSESRPPVPRKTTSMFLMANIWYKI